MQALPIVEDDHILKHLSLGFFNSLESAFVEPFHFHLAPERLHRRIVPAVAFTRHTAGISIFLQFFLVRVRAILAAAITVADGVVRLARR